MIWMPQHEVDAMKKWSDEVIERSKKLDWGFRALLQLKFEKGEFDDMDPLERHAMKLLAYGK